MPSPLDYSYKVVKPFAYETSTPPVGQLSHTNSTRSFGSGILSGAGAGSSFGPYGAAVGAAAGLATDLWQAVYAKRRAEEANEEAKKAAAEASARSSAEARAARNWNSEQSQIRRMRMAGLSPGLAYGQMSPSTAQPAPQDKADIHKADTPKFDNESILRALEYLTRQQQADTALAAQQSTSALQGSQTDLNLIDKLYKVRNIKPILLLFLQIKTFQTLKRLKRYNYSQVIKRCLNLKQMPLMLPLVNPMLLLMLLSKQVSILLIRKLRLTMLLLL